MKDLASNPRNWAEKLEMKITGFYLEWMFFMGFKRKRKAAWT